MQARHERAHDGYPTEASRLLLEGPARVPDGGTVKITRSSKADTPWLCTEN
jgi:hypothetical protein